MALGDVRQRFTIKNLMCLEVGIEGDEPVTWIGAMDVEVEMTDNGQKLVLTIKDRGNEPDGD